MLNVSTRFVELPLRESRDSGTNDKFGLAMWNRLVTTDIVHFVSPTRIFLILFIKLKIDKTLKLMAITAVHGCLYNQIREHVCTLGLIPLKI